MGEPEVDQNQLEQIGNYVKNHIGDWIREQKILPFPDRETRTPPELMERFVTIEQQLKFQNEKLEMMMDQSDKRFESLDKRFESMDKRFESMDKRFTDMQSYLDKRFESMDKRFESMDRRFYGYAVLYEYEI